jgi:hypothetical protein
MYTIYYGASYGIWIHQLRLATPYAWILSTAHNGGHFPSGKFWLKLIFSAHMNAMELIFFGGLQNMCMVHEPEGFWPTIF